MTPRRRRLGRLALFGAFAALIGIGAVAMAFNTSHSDDTGILPPLPAETTVSAGGPEPAQSDPEQAEAEPIATPPGMASLAGSPASVVRRFARDWANRNSVLTAATKREMVGLSAGAWAGAVFRQARLTLPAIEGVRAEGEMAMMKLTDVASGSKTALVVTREQLRGPDGELSPPRYEIYLARLDRVTPRGYAITAWEPQR
jgi:hypothetical protein